MSERPFMQLYVSDFVGDTLHLSPEQVGSYMLLLMAMWNARGSLPDDDVKLARIARLSVKKWRFIGPDVMAFFHRSEGGITHNRLARELEKSERKSESRSAAGKEGATAKALKDKIAHQAFVAAVPQHLPDTRRIKEEPSGSSKKRATRLPFDWVIPDDWHDEAVEHGLNPALVNVEAERMKNWSLSSKNGAKLDWHATWRNWFRNKIPIEPQGRASSKKSRMEMYGPRKLEIWELLDMTSADQNYHQKATQSEMVGALCLLAALPSREADSEQIKAAYYIALDGVTVFSLMRAVKNILQGKLGHEYFPSPVALRTQCEEVMTSIRAAEYREMLARKDQLQIAPVSVTEEDRARAKLIYEEFVKQHHAIKAQTSFTRDVRPKYDPALLDKIPDATPPQGTLKRLGSGMLEKKYLAKKPKRKINAETTRHASQ
ncbi:DUF1376 domain-containing protein [uncultured Phyllobacterium sp.]|uniref:YdaU family protein n=1 Tax=uncultured Phyllobacterium sp. TaxID=253813 RepID=UPI00258E43A6|nr:DUF1376 domain-containing protein [uncultured Phyllobacterium sp.]